MKKNLVTFLFISIFIGLIVYIVFIKKEKPYLAIGEEYPSYSNVYQNSDYEVSFMRVKDNEVNYYISVGSRYKVIINNVEYINVESEVIFDSQFEKQNIKCIIYDLDDNVVNSFEFYYSNDYSSLRFLEWNDSGIDFDKVILLVIIIGVIILEMILDKIFSKRLNSKANIINNFFENFFKKKQKNTDEYSIDEKDDVEIKKSGIFRKIVYFILFIIYLLLPYPFLFIFIIIITAVLIFSIKGIINKFIAIIIFAFSLFIGVVTFFGLYITFVPEARVSYPYQTPNISLTTEATSAYHDIIDSSTHYTKEPVAYFENEDFGFIMLRTYIEWTYNSSGEKIECIYSYRFINATKIEKSNLSLVVKHDNEILIAISFKDDISNQEFFLEDINESEIYIEIRDVVTGKIYYTSDTFPTYKNFYELPIPVYFGGQYMENESKVLILFTVFTHISTIISGLLIFLFRNKFKFKIKKPIGELK